MNRFTSSQVNAWRNQGGVLIEDFFTPAEIASVQSDFHTVFGRSKGRDEPLVRPQTALGGSFHESQFKSFDAVPFDCSPALNLIGVHPQLIAFAQAALATGSVHLYQCQAWAKFTGDADYEQPFHCDYVNHTLTTPSPNAAGNSVTILCYFTDVTESHGPMHYVPRPDSDKVAGPEATLRNDAHLQDSLRAYERSNVARAGAIFPYSIDVYHRGTNLTVPGGARFAVMACFKRAGDESVGYHAWQFHHLKPWHRIFDHASAQQLACFGVQSPGDPFWTQTTIARAQARYPNWDMTPYRAALDDTASQ